MNISVAKEWVYVGNLPFSTTKADLQSKFGSLANILEIKMAVDDGTQHFIGVAYVHLASAIEARALARQLNNQVVGERTIHAATYDEVISEADNRA
jgi:RNA recognition motif-containing protein